MCSGSKYPVEEFLRVPVSTILDICCVQEWVYAPKNCKLHQIFHKILEYKCKIFFLNLGFVESFNGAQLLKFGQIRSRGSKVIGVKN